MVSATCGTSTHDGGRNPNISSNTSSTYDRRSSGMYLARRAGRWCSSRAFWTSSRSNNFHCAVRSVSLCCMISAVRSAMSCAPDPVSWEIVIAGLNGDWRTVAGFFSYPNWLTTSERLPSNVLFIFINRSFLLLFAQTFEQRFDLRSDAAELFFVHGRKFFQRFVTARGQRQLHLAAVGAVLPAGYEASQDQAVDEANSAVVADLQALGQFANGNATIFRKALDCQQRLMLLGH